MKKAPKLFGICYVLVFCTLFGMAFSQDDRESWQPPEQIMDSIGVKPGMLIGEPGAGRGYFTFPLSKRVGQTGKIYANDISQYRLNDINERAEEEGIENIETVLGEEEDPLFPEKNLDMIIMVYVLHHIDKPVTFLENTKKYMAKESSLVVIERDTEKDRSQANHFMSKKQVLDTAHQSKFTVHRIETFLEKDTIYIFEVK